MATMASLSASTSLLQGVKFCTYLVRGLARKLQILGREWLTVLFLGEKFFLRSKGSVFFLHLFIFLSAVNVK